MMVVLPNGDLEVTDNKTGSKTVLNNDLRDHLDKKRNTRTNTKTKDKRC